jgi:hypothetical protein
MVLRRLDKGATDCGPCDWFAVCSPASSPDVRPPPTPNRPPGLPQLYGYMLANRRKVLGGGAKKKAKAA